MSSVQIYDLLQEGELLSTDEVERLEEVLQTKPTEVNARIKLTGYYARKKFENSEVKALHFGHLSWFVDNHPDHELFDFVQDISRDFDGRQVFSDLKHRWLEHTERDDVKTTVLRNAAHFFMQDDRLFAERCLLKAQATEPNEAQWSSELAMIYGLWGIGYEDKALAECKRALELSSSPQDKFYQFTDLPERAFSAARYKEAFNAAGKLLEMSKEHKSDWNYGNAINSAHTVLGLVALQKKDFELAIHHLLESAKDVASPQTESFGPNLRLAAELIALGEIESVERYWDLCGIFWESNKLEDWRTKIRAGENPLDYLLHEKRALSQCAERPRELFISGQYANAGAAAKQLLRVATDRPDDVNHHGFALHVANVVLGQLALRGGDSALAKTHLTAAAKVPYSKQLAHHGPDLSLAADLAQGGEASAAIVFLNEVEQYWPDGAEKPNPSDFVDKAQKGTLNYDLLW